jgi:hypothetical protein
MACSQHACDPRACLADVHFLTGIPPHHVAPLKVGAWNYWTFANESQVKPANPADDVDTLLCEAKRSGMVDEMAGSCDTISSCSVPAYKAICPFLCAECSKPSLVSYGSDPLGFIQKGPVHDISCQKEDAWTRDTNDINSYIQLALTNWHGARFST